MVWLKRWVDVVVVLCHFEWLQSFEQDELSHYPKPVRHRTDSELGGRVGRVIKHFLHLLEIEHLFDFEGLVCDVRVVFVAGALAESNRDHVVVCQCSEKKIKTNH